VTSEPTLRQSLPFSLSVDRVNDDTENLAAMASGNRYRQRGTAVAIDVSHAIASSANK
jgi:hypothetical protein